MLELQFHLLGDRLEIWAHENAGGAAAILVGDSTPYPQAQISVLSLELHQALNNQHSRRENIEALGQQLYDLLLGPRIKETLRTTRADHLLLQLPETLLHIPWELLHDGDTFISLRFAMGRMVVLNQAPVPPRAPQRPHRMLVLCDPRDNLPHAAKEGQRLREALRGDKQRIRLELQGGPFDRQVVLAGFRSHGLIHYAGHAVGSGITSPPGWLLEGPSLAPEDILTMLGGRVRPELIFANACYSAVAEQAGSLPSTFLRVGVQHYIGAVSELPDLTSAGVAAHFYAGLLAGKSVGQALRDARLPLAQSAQQPLLAWAGYVLYGSPGKTYFDPGDDSHRSHPEKRPPSAPFLEKTPPPDIIPVPSEPPSPLHETHPPQQKAPTPVSQEPPPPIPPSQVEVPPAPRPRLLQRAAAVLVGLAGAVLGLMGTIGVLGPLELVWESGRYLGHAGNAYFSTPILLLGIEPDDAPQARALYAGLLEQLTQQQKVPAVVAFDTWLREDTRTEHDSRLVQAIARAIQHFPVVFGLERDPVTHELKPPPLWLTTGLDAELQRIHEHECTRSQLSTLPREPSSVEVQDCVRSQTHTDKTLRLRWSDLYIQRPPGVFQFFGLKVPLLYEPRDLKAQTAQTEGDVGSTGDTATPSGTLQKQLPHFSTQLAFPGAIGLAPDDAHLQGEARTELAYYDDRGMMPVVFTGRASWTNGPAFPAMRLSEFLSGDFLSSESLRARTEVQAAGASPQGAARPEAVALVLKNLESPRQLRLLVGSASQNTRGNEMDLYNTPIGRMFGVEVLANSAEALATRQAPRQLRHPWSWGLVVAGSVFGWLGLKLSSSSRFSRFRARLTLLGGTMGLLLLSYGALEWLQVSVPPVVPILALGLGYGVGSVVRPARPQPSRWQALLAVAMTALLVGEPLAFAQTTSPSPSAKSQATTGPTAKVPTKAPGWRILWVRPPDPSFVTYLLSANRTPMTVQDLLPGGTVLRSDRPDARVAIEFSAPELGMLITHELSGTFQVTLEAFGQVSLQSGTIWTRLYRTLREPFGKLFMEYEGTPAGFGSTEVVYQRHPGIFGSRPQLMVLEGKVTYKRGNRTITLEEGESASWGARPGSPHASDPQWVAFWVARGTEVVQSQLNPDGLCPANNPALAEAGLISKVCYPTLEARNAELALGRSSMQTGITGEGFQRAGNALLAAERYEEAADSYRRGAQLGKDAEVAGRSWLELGNAQWLSGRTAEALAAFEMAVQLDLSQAPGWNNLGILLSESGKQTEAKDALRRAVKLDPTAFQSWRNLGRVLVDESPQDAILAWQNARKLSPQDVPLLTDLAAAFQTVGRKLEALEIQETLLSLPPTSGENIGETQINPESYAALAAEYEKLAQEYQRQGRQREALQLLDKAMELRMKAGK